MKLYNVILLALLVCLSCGKDDDEIQKEGNCLTAVINGEDFTAESTIGIFSKINIDYENQGNQETRLLTINGTIPGITEDTKIITLTFACTEFASELDYLQSDPDCGIDMRYQITSFINPNSSEIIVGTEGGINVEEVTDNKIRGTFTFKGESQNGTNYNITNGFFDTTIAQ